MVYNWSYSLHVSPAHYFIFALAYIQHTGGIQQIFDIHSLRLNWINLNLYQHH